MHKKLCCLTSVLLLAAASAAPAQVVPDRFQVGPRLGWVNFEEVSGIKRAGLVGLDATYFLTRSLGVGLSVDFARPQTDGRYFPAEMSFGDTTFIFQVENPLTVFQYQLTAVGTVSLGRLNPFVTVGWGQYKLFLDPEAARNPTEITHPLLTLGGGLNLRLGESSGLRLEVRNFIYSGYDLNELNRVESRFNPRRFPEVAPVPDRQCYDATCRLQNIQFAVGFSFVPGGRP